MSVFAIALTPAYGGQYQASTETELRDSFTAANAETGPSTITITGDIAISTISGFTPGPNRITIDLNGHTITGYTSPTSGYAVSFFGPIDIINSGTIVGGAGNVGTTQVGAIGLVVSPPADGANIINDGLIVGGAGGTGGTGANGGSGAQILGNTRLTNNATIRGGEGGGTAGGGGAGLFMNGGEVVNYGLIEGGVSHGAAVGSGFILSGTNTITNNGTIRGSTGASAATGVSGAGMQSTNGRNTVINNGLIEGGTGGAAITASQAFGQWGQYSIINNGTIKAGPGQTDAIRFSTDSRAVNVLEMYAGSVIDGNVVATAAGSSDTFRLGGAANGSFDLTEIGVGLKYQNFDIFQKTGTSTWTVTGTIGQATAPWEVLDGTLAVNGTILGTMAVTSGRLQGTGSLGDTTNHAAGVIAPGNSIGTLTVAGDYTGDGGLLEIEAVLGDDTSPADLLHITGNASGTTNVRVINLGGTGAQTTEGIRIVQVDGTSAAGAFGLLGDYVYEGDQAVVGGAYAYRLYQGSAARPDDWYLRSDLIAGDPSAGALLQPGVPLYESYANVLQSFNKLGTMRQRLSVQPGVVKGDQGPVLWGRFFADHGQFAPGSSTSGATFDVTSTGLYLGSDGELGNGLVGGFNVRVGGATAGVESSLGNGLVATTGLGLGGTLTWSTQSGFYLDAQAQVSLFGSSLHSSTANRTLVSGNGGYGYGASVEVGQEIALGPNWSLTPQAQLAWSEVRFDDFTDAFGAAVSLGQSRSLTGRLGLAADYKIEGIDAAGQASDTRFYGTADLYYDFGGGSTAEVSGVRLASVNNPLWAGIGLGGSHSWGDGKYTVHGEALVKAGIANPNSNYALGGTLGMHVAW